MPDLVEILVTAKDLTAPAFASARKGATDVEATMSKVTKVANASALAMVAFLGESVHMASKFDSEMSLLSTQAGVAEEKLGGLKKGVLSIAAKVGADPDSLAEALFHVESNFESMGITSENALKLTETAAKGAAVGHASLVDVTNALTAAVASGIPGVENFDKAMGVLNATVGVGDMKMQDLANAFGSGMVATVKGFGLSIQDVGAALATFGDNNIRGSLAGTQLRMSVMALAKPISTSEAALKTLGLTQTTLADDMQRGGLKLALEDLVGRMNAAGISADKQGQIITDAFGRKAGAGLNILVGQIDRLESKYPALEAGANNFGKAWEKTSQTFAQQEKQLEGSLQALMISVGEKLIPYLQKGTTWMLNNRDTMLELAKAAGVVVGALAGFAVITKTVALFNTLATGFRVARTAMIEFQMASMAAGGGVQGLAAGFSGLSSGAKFGIIATGVGLVATSLFKLREAQLDKVTPDLGRMKTAMEHLGTVGMTSGELTKTFGDSLDKLGYAVDRVAGKSQGMDHFNDVMNGIFTLGTMKSNSLETATRQIGSIDQALASMVQEGHADLAAKSLKDLQDAFAVKGGDPEKLAGQFHKYKDALGASAETEKIAAQSMGVLGEQAMTTSKTLDAQKMSVEGLKGAIVDLNDANRSALDGMAGLYAAIDAGAKSLDENGASLHMVNGELDLHSEKARNNEKALSDLAAKTDAAAEAALNNGDSWDKVNGIYQTGRDNLIKLARQMGLSSDQARDLADSILSIPDRNITVKTNYVNVHTEVGASGDTYQHGFARASGGVVGAAASGGVRAGMTLVGEEGPELVKLPAGATVSPAGGTRAMLQAAAAGGGGPQVLQVEWIGSNAGDEFMKWLRKNIRIKGGNVQAVLGQ